MTLDEAIELLEITEDIDKITDEKLREKRRRAMQRWHPDTVPLSDSATKERYEYQFKNIEVALGIIAKYRAGNILQDRNLIMKLHLKVPEHRSSKAK
ncbi:MAG: hypothetical protein IPM81_01975 [Saprospirales bacterium]|nr:hypothetical protein [Saprospirales bacterium]